MASLYHTCEGTAYILSTSCGRWKMYATNGQAAIDRERGRKWTKREIRTSSEAKRKSTKTLDGNSDVLHCFSCIKRFDGFWKGVLGHEVYLGMSFSDCKKMKAGCTSIHSNLQFWLHRVDHGLGACIAISGLKMFCNVFYDFSDIFVYII